MKEESAKFEQQLSRLADALVNDILSTSDENILAEANETAGGAAKAVEHIDAMLNDVRMRIGKTKLAAARAAVGGTRLRTLRVVEMSFDRKKQVIQEFVSSDENLRLTMAARKGKEVTENDIDAILQALSRVGSD